MSSHKTFVGILLQKVSNAQYEDAYVLLVEDTGEHYERVGGAFISRDRLEYAGTRNRTLKTKLRRTKRKIRLG